MKADTLLHYIILDMANMKLENLDLTTNHIQL